MSTQLSTETLKSPIASMGSRAQSVSCTRSGCTHARRGHSVSRYFSSAEGRPCSGFGERGFFGTRAALPGSRRAALVGLDVAGTAGVGGVSVVVVVVGTAGGVGVGVGGGGVVVGTAGVGGGGGVATTGVGVATAGGGAST